MILGGGNPFICRVSWSKRLAAYQIEKLLGTNSLGQAICFYVHVKSAPQILACPYFSGMSTICSEIQYTGSSVKYSTTFSN